MERLYRAQDIMSVKGGHNTTEYDYEKDILEVRSVGVILTYRCTLRCKFCCTRAPFYHPPMHPSLDGLKSDIKNWFSMADYTMKIDLQGGEPLIRNDLAEYMNYLLEFRKQFGRVRLITNGTLPISNEVIEVLKRYEEQADVLIDHYGDELSTHALEIGERLMENKIPYILRRQDKDNMYLNGWFDYREPLKTRILLSVS